MNCDLACESKVSWRESIKSVLDSDLKLEKITDKVLNQTKSQKKLSEEEALWQ